MKKHEKIVCTDDARVPASKDDGVVVDFIVFGLSLYPSWGERLGSFRRYRQPPKFMKANFGLPTRGRYGTELR